MGAAPKAASLHRSRRTAGAPLVPRYIPAGAQLLNGALQSMGALAQRGGTRGAQTMAENGGGALFVGCGITGWISFLSTLGLNWGEKPGKFSL